MNDIVREVARLLTLNNREQYILVLRSMTDDELEYEYWLAVEWELPRHRYLCDCELLRRGIVL